MVVACLSFAGNDLHTRGLEMLIKRLHKSLSSHLDHEVDTATATRGDRTKTVYSYRGVAEPGPAARCPLPGLEVGHNTPLVIHS